MGLGCERLVEGSFDEVISAQFFPKMRRAYDRAFQLLLMLMASRFHEKLREAESQKASPLASSAQLEKKKKKERVLNKSKYKNETTTVPQRWNTPFDLDSAGLVVEKLHLVFNLLHGAHARPLLPSHTEPLTLHREHGCDDGGVEKSASDDFRSSGGLAYFLWRCWIFFFASPMNVPFEPTSTGGASSFLWNILRVCSAAWPLP